MSHHDAGIDLAHVAHIPDVGAEGPTVVAALLDGIEHVIVGPACGLLDADRRGLLARARGRGTALISTTPWHGAALSVDVQRTAWAGPDRGGHWLRAPPPGTVLDGELVIWAEGRLDFGALQQRMARGDRAAAALGYEQPAFLALFDVLAVAGKDVRGGPFDARRALLEELATEWRPPLNRSPVTDDVNTAAEWFETYTIAGVEGLMVKGGAHPYRDGERVWVKVKHRRTVDVVCAAVIGTRTAPQQVVAGLPLDGELQIVGRTGPLSPAVRRALKPPAQLDEEGISGRCGNVAG